jgi:hypothetical protein
MSVLLETSLFTSFFYCTTFAFSVVAFFVYRLINNYMVHAFTSQTIRQVSDTIHDHSDTLLYLINTVYPNVHDNLRPTLRPRPLQYFPPDDLVSRDRYNDTLACQPDDSESTHTCYFAPNDLFSRNRYNGTLACPDVGTGCPVNNLFANTNMFNESSVFDHNVNTPNKNVNGDTCTENNEHSSDNETTTSDILKFICTVLQTHSKNGLKSNETSDDNTSENDDHPTENNSTTPEYLIDIMKHLGGVVIKYNENKSKSDETSEDDKSENNDKSENDKQ